MARHVLPSTAAAECCSAAIFAAFCSVVLWFTGRCCGHSQSDDDFGSADSIFVDGCVAAGAGDGVYDCLASSGCCDYGVAIAEDCGLALSVAADSSKVMAVSRQWWCSTGHVGSMRRTQAAFCDVAPEQLPWSTGDGIDCTNLAHCIEGSDPGEGVSVAREALSTDCGASWQQLPHCTDERVGSTSLLHCTAGRQQRPPFIIRAARAFGVAAMLLGSLAARFIVYSTVQRVTDPQVEGLCPRGEAMLGQLLVLMF